MPADALKMGLDYSQLRNASQVGGMGGSADCYSEEAVLLFDEPNRRLMRFYAVWLVIPEPDPELGNMPPILGRDVLDQWYMHYDPSRGRLSFTVRNADRTQKV